MKLIRKYKLIFIMLVIYSCKKDNTRSNFIGTYELIRNDSLKCTLVTDEDFQMIFFPDNKNIDSQFFEISWRSYKSYVSKRVNSKNKFDSSIFTVEIDSINNDTIYQSRYNDELNLKVLRELVKKSNTLGDKFLNSKKKWIKTE